MLARLSLAISQLICVRVEDCVTVLWFFLGSIGISRIHGKPSSIVNLFRLSGLIELPGILSICAVLRCFADR